MFHNDDLIACRPYAINAFPINYKELFTGHCCLRYGAGSPWRAKDHGWSVMRVCLAYDIPSKDESVSEKNGHEIDLDQSRLK